jgi:hypothetical protein
VIGSPCGQRSVISFQRIAQAKACGYIKEKGFWLWLLIADS